MQFIFRLKSMAPTTKTWLTILAESAIAFTLVVSGIYAAGFLHAELTTRFHGAYVFWFALAMIPSLIFACKRNAVYFDRWDAMATVPFLFCIACAGSLAIKLRGDHPFWMLVIPAVGIMCSPIVAFTRKHLPAANRHSDTDSSHDAA